MPSVQNAPRGIGCGTGARRLPRHRLDADKDEYVFHDWADYQPDGDEVDAKRRKRSEAGKKGASRRWKKPENGKNGKPMANAWQDDGKPMANACPVPVPVPDKKEEEYYSSKEDAK